MGGSARDLAISVLLLAMLAGCNGADEPPAPIDAPPVEPGDEGAVDRGGTARAPTRYRVVPADTGTIEGVVRWRGRRPPNPELEVHAQHRVCGREQEVPALRIGRGGGVADVLVHLVDVEAGPRRRPTAVAELDQIGCRYVPHTLAVMRGQEVLFRNSDEVLHNVHGIWEDGEEWLDVGQPRVGSTTTRTADRTGVARVVCDAGHAWMLGWVHVLDHPYFAVTDEMGRFRLEEVPVGDHELRLWHQGWEVVGARSGRPHFGDPVVLTRAVTVQADGVADLELVLPPPDEPETPAQTPDEAQDEG